MKQSRFSERKIVAILKQHKLGARVPNIYREHGISVGTIYNWKAKYVGMDAPNSCLLQYPVPSPFLKQRFYFSHADVCIIADADKDALASLGVFATDGVWVPPLV